MTKKNLQTIIAQAAKAIAQADALFISAGAGMGVDSGMPDFRGDKGFWKAYPAVKAEGLSFYDLANPKWFKDDPARAWGFYGHRYNLYKRTQPHAGFAILKKWADAKQDKTGIAPFVFTSNVDGHFQKAGFADAQVYECHGSINHLQCQTPCHDAIWEMPEVSLDVDEATLTAKGDLPICPQCGKVARPNILMFGDGYWVSHRSDKQERRYWAWRNKLKKAVANTKSNVSIVTIEMGAGKAIPTVRYASDAMAGTTIRINPRDSDGNANTMSLPLGALEGLQLLDDLLNQ